MITKKATKASKKGKTHPRVNREKKPSTKGRYAEKESVCA